MNNSYILAGYRAALGLAASHYENFPVVSWFIRKELRDDVAIIYWFARTADDLADEGNDDTKKRLADLDKFAERLQTGLQGNYLSELDAALAETIHKHSLDPENFFALISAFKQDVVKKRYDSMDELMDYCSRSANPVGRLILGLHGFHDQDSYELSDKICTALQLANFWQDVSVDILKDRIYVPAYFMKIFGVPESDFRNPETTVRFRSMMKILCEYTENLFEEGKELIQRLPKPLRYEIAWTVLGGKKTLDKIKKISYTVTCERVTLRKHELIRLGIRSIFYD